MKQISLTREWLVVSLNLFFYVAILAGCVSYGVVLLAFSGVLR